MSISKVLKYGPGVLVAAGLLGCNGFQPEPGAVEASTAPSITLRALMAHDGRLNAAHPDRRRSWISPEARRKRLLYISDADTYDVDVFALPSGKPVGVLSGFDEPYGLCSDGSHIWVANALKSEIIEYKAGGSTPVATLMDPGQYPAGCAYDKTTGNLAVTNVISVISGEGGVAVYAKASGKPKTYICSGIFEYYYGGYDDKGNLYVDGEDSISEGGFALCGLRKGSGSMQTISLNQSIDYPGQVQWDGEYVTVSDQNTDTIYRFSIKGTSGTEEGNTSLEGADDCAQNWIEKNKVYCPADGSAAAYIYAYPAGGIPMKTITGFGGPAGATVARSRT